MIISVLSKETQQGKSVTVAHLATIASRGAKACAIDWDERHGSRSLGELHAKHKPLTDYDLRNGDSDLSELMEVYSHIIIDTEGNLPKAKTQALSKSDVVLIPTGLQASELDAAMQTVHELRDANEDANYAVLFTGVNDSATFESAYHEFSRRHRVETINTFIPFSQDVANLAAQGLTAFDNRQSMEARGVASAYQTVWGAINERV